MIAVTRDSDGKPEFVELSQAERQCGRENYDFYCFLIWPFIEASWLGTVSLLGLTPPRDGPQDVWIDMKKAENNAQLVSLPTTFPHGRIPDSYIQLGKTLYHQGDLSYFEAVNKEALKNSYQRFVEEGIIVVAKDKGSGSSTLMKLAPEWTPERDPDTDKLLPHGRLWDFTERIAQCRREG